MKSLLELVLEAHGGLKLWNGFSDVVTNVEVSGQICERNQLKRIMPLARFLLSLREQRVIITLPEDHKQLFIQPDSISLIGERGLELERLVDPKMTLMQEGPDTAWDILRGAYFVGSTIWHNVTAPFLYTFPGFDIQEVEPWSEDGEIWRVLRITFPTSIDAHARVQYAYYDDDGLLRRQRYKVDVLGGLECVNYVTGYEKLSGIMVPTSRVIFGCDTNAHKLEQASLAEIRLLEPFFSD